MENKQMIHIASEVIALVGLTFYFNQKNKKLMGHIEDLAQRIEDQEEIIQKHEQMIQQLANVINSMKISPVQPEPVAPARSEYQPDQIAEQSQSRRRKPSNNSSSQARSGKDKTLQRKRGFTDGDTRRRQHTEPPLEEPREELREEYKPRVSFDEESMQTKQSRQVVEEVLSDEESSDLDAELADELGELEETSENE